MSVLLSVQGLAKSYAHRALFDDLSLDLRVGERIGLIGPNGAGKSTLLKILAGLEAPDEGAVSLRRGVRIGYLSQDDLFPPGQSVREAVLAGLTDATLEEHERETRTRPSPSPSSASTTPTGPRRSSPAAGRSGSRSRGNWPASPTSSCWTSRPTTSTCRASSGSNVCCGRELRLPRRHPRPRIPPRRRRRGGRGQPHLPRGLLPLRRRLRHLRGAAGRVPRSPGPAAAVGRQPGAEGIRLAGPQGVGPAQEVAVAHRRGRPAARAADRPQVSQRGVGGRGHRLRRHRPADAQAAHRHRPRQVARRPAALPRPRPVPHAGCQARPARPQRQRQEHAAAGAGGRDRAGRRDRGAGRRPPLRHVRAGPGVARPLRHSPPRADAQRRHRHVPRPPHARGCVGQPVPVQARAARPGDERPFGRRAGPRPHRPAHAPAGGRAAARRAHERPGHSRTGGARRDARRLPGRGGVGEPRPRPDGPALHGGGRARWPGRRRSRTAASASG